MATTYTGYVAGSFRRFFTGKKEMLLNLEPAATINAKVGDIYKLASGELTRVAVTGKASAATAAADVIDAVKSAVKNSATPVYILAQSDMTLGEGHVPVENRNYAYSNQIAMTDGAKRDFAVYEITDEDIDLDNIIFNTTTVAVSA